MNTNGDDEPQGNQETGSPAGSLSIEQLVRTAPFPVYGLVQTPPDLILHGIGYSTADRGVGRPAPPWPSNPSQVLWQVSVVYGYPPGHQNLRPRLELITTSIAHYPAPVPTIEDLVRASATHYPSEDEVPTLSSQPADFLIERFALIEGQAAAVVAYTPDAPRSRGSQDNCLEGRSTSSLMPAQRRSHRWLRGLRPLLIGRSRCATPRCGWKGRYMGGRSQRSFRSSTSSLH